MTHPSIRLRSNAACAHMPSAGISLGSAAFYVQHPVLGALCFLCNVISTDVLASGGVSFQPVDGYRRRVRQLRHCFGPFPAEFAAACGTTRAV